MCSTGMGGVYNNWGEFLLVILLIFLRPVGKTGLAHATLPLQQPLGAFPAIHSTLCSLSKNTIELS